MTKWTANDVPDQRSRTAVITGANTGIGFHAASVLASRGAHVVLAVRNEEKGALAAARIRHRAGDSDVSVVRLDLTSLASVRDTATEILSTCPRVDCLINNAGVMMTPEATTADGFEMQFGTNHLGHFAFTGLLLNRLLATPYSRVVTISSLAHRMKTATNVDDAGRRYDSAGAYGRSKLANLLFTYELARRLKSIGTTTIAVAAHPGGARTDLARSTPLWLRLAFAVMFQAPERGALPTLRAATDPAGRNGEYYGPSGFREQRGYPKVVQSSAASHDEELQKRLWKESEEATGVVYPV